MLEAFMIKSSFTNAESSRFFQRNFDPSFVEKANNVEINIQKFDNPNSIAELQTKCEAVDALNQKVEIMGVEPYLKEFEATHGHQPIAIGGPALPDVLGVNPETGILQITECKGTSVDHRKINDLGLVNDKRIENSPEWLDNNSDRMLSAIQKRLEVEPNNPQLQLIEEKLTDIINEGGFEMNPDQYESSLSISCKEGAIDVYGESNQNALNEWVQATGSTRIDIHNFDPNYVEAITNLD